MQSGTKYELERGHYCLNILKLSFMELGISKVGFMGLGICVIVGIITKTRYLFDSGRYCLCD